MNDLGLNLARVFHQAVENVDCLAHAARDKMGKQSDVLVADQVMRDPSVTAVTNVILREQILFIKIPFRSVGGCAFARSPKRRQQKSIVTVDDLGNRLIQRLFGNMPLIDPGDLPTIHSSHRLRRLRRSEIAAVCEYGGQISDDRVVEFRLMPGKRAEVARPIEPFLGIGHRVQ
jgi:hypothetical protein